MITAVEMPDWEIRPHRVRLIQFDGRSWRVAGKTTAAGKVHYELAPWWPADEYVTGPQIDYGTAYVMARDHAARAANRSSHVTFLLRVVSPFIGFLPGRTKTRLEAAYGVDPVATTFQSVFLEFLITICSFAMAAIGTFVLAHAQAALLPGTTGGLSVVLLLVIGLVSAIDGATRYSRILREERPPPGFYEWLVRRPPRF